MPLASLLTLDSPSLFRSSLAPSSPRISLSGRPVSVPQHARAESLIGGHRWCLEGGRETGGQGWGRSKGRSKEVQNRASDVDKPPGKSRAPWVKMGQKRGPVGGGEPLGTNCWFFHLPLAETGHRGLWGSHLHPDHGCCGFLHQGHLHPGDPFLPPSFHVSSLLLPQNSFPQAEAG